MKRTWVGRNYNRARLGSFVRLSLSLVILLGLQLVLAVVDLGKVTPAQAATLPAGFQDNIVINGLTNPTVVKFATDGRVFVAEKSGLIKVFANLDNPAPTIFADLRTQVHNFWDRGLLGLALDPDFPTKPYVYVLYTHDAAIGGTAPRWGDGCPNPPGATTDGCVVSGRLSRLTAAGNVASGPEQVLIEDWCQQFPSHSVGSLAFGPDGALYASSGDGASFNFADYGQTGSPLNPCGDPPGGVGRSLTAPTAEGGALRSQSLRRPAGEPVALNGSIVRIDPATGAALPTNPLSGNSNPNAARIVATGMRNPFRFTLRPGTSEIWAGDVGWNTWEEINRVVSPTGPAVTNFGWPCYEGVGRQGGYDSLNVNICENLYASPGAVTDPYYTYNHGSKVVAGETCPTGGSSIAGLAFYDGGNYPAAYNGSLFFADYSRNCIWVMNKGTNGLPDPNSRATFVASAANPVNLQIGPNGDLFYVDFGSGAIHRIQYFSANQPPTAIAQATPTSGAAPLTVNFDGSASSDPDPGDSLSYAWDLDGDGNFNDATGPKPTFTYTLPGTYNVRLQVTDSQGATRNSAILPITAANTPPQASIISPLASAKWKVGDLITFSGQATDPQEGTLPPSALSWSLVLRHCSTDLQTCHAHPIQNFNGVSSGSFAAPDHEYPSYLELQLTATDSGGLSDSKTDRLDPQTTTLALQSNPAGLQLGLGSENVAAPFQRTVIVGSANSISAPAPQTLGSNTYNFGAWSNGGSQNQIVVAGTTTTTLTATYNQLPTTNQTLLGSNTILAGNDYNPAGSAEAFIYTATATGTANQVAVYLDSTNTATKIVVGIYANTAGDNPGALLTQASLTNPTKGAWNTLSVPGANLAAGTKYWIAVLGPLGAGTLQFRDTGSGGKAVASSQSNLSNLPATWTSGGVYNNSPMSAYVMQVGTPGPDTQPPTVALTAPANGATVAGNAVSLTASATDNVGVVSLQFLLDGNPLGAALTASPYNLTWNTTGVPNGPHTLSVRAKDAANNVATSTGIGVTVANDSVPPVITAINAGSIQSNAATITWTTDEPATTQVEFGTSTAYGSLTTLNSTLSTGHSQVPSGLNPSTTYHYRVLSRDASGNAAASPDFSFTTTAGTGTPQTLVGISSTLTNLDNNPAGSAEAFQYTASGSGIATKLYVYIDAGSTATKVVVGLYTNNASNNPGSLLTQATITNPIKGAWNSVSVPGTNLTAGAKYWLAVLGPAGSGTVQFRDTGSGGKAQASLQTNLTSLPATWTPGTTYFNSPMSAYATT